MTRRRPRWRELVERIDGWSQAGADVRAQVAVRPIGVLLGLTATANPLRRCPTYARLHDLPVAERVAHLADPATRADIIAEHGEARVRDFPALIHAGFDRMYPLTDPPNYEPVAEDSVAGLAAAEGVAPVEKMYDLMLADEGGQLLYMPLMNYAAGNLDDVREMILSEHSMFGLSDAGAHCNVISDGTFPTTAITHWTRDRTRGEQIDLEYVVHQQTQRTAAHVGWNDRGVVAPGYLADLNIIDHAGLGLHPPHLVADLPAGGTRLMQAATGYVATIKRGRVTVDNGVLTGDRPGRLQRGAQPAPA